MVGWLRMGEMGWLSRFIRLCLNEFISLCNGIDLIDVALPLTSTTGSKVRCKIEEITGIIKLPL